MEYETDKDERVAMLTLFKFWLIYGAALILVAYGGHLWKDSRTKTVDLATCQEMLPNAVVDCPLAAAVAECDAKFPWAKCEILR